MYLVIAELYERLAPLDAHDDLVGYIGAETRTMRFTPGRVGPGGQMRWTATDGWLWLHQISMTVTQLTSLAGRGRRRPPVRLGMVDRRLLQHVAQGTVNRTASRGRALP